MSNLSHSIDIKNFCVICLDNYSENDIKKLYCNHIYCKNCINKWLQENNTCPICRIDISTNNNENENNNIIPHYFNISNTIKSKIKYCIIISIYYIMSFFIIFLIGTLIYKILLLFICLIFRGYNFSWCIKDTFVNYYANYLWEWILGIIFMCFFVRTCIYICSNNDE